MLGTLLTFAWALVRLLLHVVYYPILVFLWALLLCVLLGSAREFLETTMVDPPAQKRLHDLLQQLFSDRQMGELGDLPASTWRGWEQHQQQLGGHHPSHHHQSLSNPSAGGAHLYSLGGGGAVWGLTRARGFFTSRRRMVVLLVAVGVCVLYLVLSTHRLPALLRATLDWRVWLSVYRGTSGVVVGGGKAVRVLFTPSTFAWVLKWRWEGILLALLSPALAWVALVAPQSGGGGVYRWHKWGGGRKTGASMAPVKAKGGHPHHEHATSAPSRPPLNTPPTTTSLPPLKEEEKLGGIYSDPSTHQTPPATPLPPIYTPHTSHTGLQHHQNQPQSQQRRQHHIHQQQQQQQQQSNPHQDTHSVATDSPGSLTFSTSKSVGGGSVGTAGGGRGGRGGGGVMKGKEGVGGGEEEARRKAALLRSHARNERRISLLRNVAQRACVTLEEVARSTPLRGGGY